MISPNPTQPHALSELSDFTRDRRLVPLTALAGLIGAIAAGAGWGLLKLVNLATQISFHGRFSFADTVPVQGHAGPWVILVPIAGGLIIGLMARFGSEKIRGHGIPEALEAILIGRSRMSRKVAVLKPLSSAIPSAPAGLSGPRGPSS
jgi:H+/Cl- antiporter ClcA